MKCIAKIHAAKGGGLPTFEGLAYTGVDMQPMGWGGRVVIDLAGVVIPNQHRPVLRQHDPEKIAGHTTKVDVHRTKGITVAGVFSGQPEHVNAVVVPAKNGFQWQMSIGADPLEISYLDAGKETKVNGRTVAGPLAISRRTVLGEVSFVPLGADGATSAYVNAKHAHKLLAAATPAQCWSIGERDDGDIDIKALTRQIMAEARDD
ncbi:MAG TPA: hypothetical protein VFE62_02995, partial [Gemmataceae bacterium]|nr:hypothetical protein [Gemmataceae bacterium]